MITIVMKSWRDGLEKVALSKLQIELLNIPLKEAKKNVDMLLDDHPIRIQVEEENMAKDFIKRADAIGVDCFIESNHY